MMNDIVNSLTGKLACASFVGRSPLFADAVRGLPRIAGDRAAVLIEGETGTGKELVARALHYLGPRAATRSRRSIAERSRTRCSKTNCSATSAAPLRTLRGAAKE